jgi:hypothetical protein
MKKSIHSSRCRSEKHPRVIRGLLLGVSLAVLALLLLAVAAQAGVFWNPDGVPISRSEGNQYYPASVSDSAGGAIITWYDYRGNNSNIYAQRVDSSGKTLWATNGVGIRNASPSSAYDPQIATDGAGGAIITWYDYRSPEGVYAQRVNPQGVVQWVADGVKVTSGSFQSQYDPQIAYDGAGGAVITWRDYRSPAGIYAQRLNGAGAALWGTAGVAVCTADSSYNRQPDIATDGAHGAIITWQDERNGSQNLDIFAQRVDQTGAPAWTPDGINVCTAPGNQQSPQIASDNAGGAVITWEDSRSTAQTNVYAQRVSLSGSTLWTLNGIRVASSTGNQQSPQLTTDGSGNAIITWEDARSNVAGIYAQKLLANGAVAPEWPAHGLAVSTGNIGHYQPVVTGDGSGGAIIAWTQGSSFYYDSGGSSGGDGISTPRVYAQQILPNGKVSPAWANNGEPVTDIDVPQATPTIVSDGAGGAIVAWEDYRSSNADVYAQRVRAAASTWYLAEGTSAWGFNTYITIENPNGSDVQARITYMTPAGALAPRNVTLPALSQTTVAPSNDIGFNTDFSTKVESSNGMPIGVDRTMYWTGPGAPSPEGHSSIGVNSPNATWYLPEGSSAWGFECWLLVQNPNANPATCNFTYMIEGGAPKVVTKTVPANSRQSFNMADEIGQQDASIQVVSNIPVIAERSMYRNNRREGSDSIGTTQTSTDYYLAEGTTNYGFTSYVLVQNPNSSPCIVSLTYMTPQGPKSQPPFSMAAYSRKTVRVNDVLPNSDFSTQVHADLPVIAERSLYWGADTALGEAMHDSVGIAAAHTMWYLPDGQSSEGRQTYTLVQNPNDAPVVVEISYLSPGGGTGNVTFQDTIAAQSRKTYSLADRVPSGRAAIQVTCKTGGRKIISERSMYWNNRGAGTCTIGGYSN